MGTVDSAKSGSQKKYFVNSGKVLSPAKPAAENHGRPLSRVLDASSVALSSQPVVIGTSLPDPIKVETVKEGKKIKGIRITCPCGRHAYMDVKYEE